MSIHILNVQKEDLDQADTQDHEADHASEEVHDLETEDREVVLDLETEARKNLSVNTLIFQSSSIEPQPL